MDTQKRESLGSRLGFILLSAGCAIGIGNVWRFPWLAGRYGGAWFVLLYAFFLIALGIPVMTMEFSVGRAAQKSPVASYRALGRPRWTWHGLLGFAGCTLLMSYYTSVSGWMLYYFIDTARGSFTDADAAAAGERFGNLLANPVAQIVPMGIVVVLGFGVCAASLRSGVERIVKWMMLALLFLMIALAVHNVMLPGAREGVKYFIVPNAANVAANGGWLRVAAEAMNQAFFTLSLGVGSMAIFGSYIGRDRALLGEAARVTALDTFVAIAAGFIVIPACFAFNVKPGAGPGLVFVTLPAVFGGMAGGRFWGAIFFAFLSFAAFSTVIAVFENILACFRDLTGLSRRSAAPICAASMFLLSLPCSLGWSALARFKPFGEGSGVLDFEDFFVSNLILPIGAIAYVLFCTRNFGWGWKSFIGEANTGRGLRVPTGKAMQIYSAYAIPAAVLLLLILGLVDKFGG